MTFRFDYEEAMKLNWEGSQLLYPLQRLQKAGVVATPQVTPNDYARVADVFLAEPSFLFFYRHAQVFETKLEDALATWTIRSQ